MRIFQSLMLSAAVVVGLSSHSIAQMVTTDPYAYILQQRQINELKSLHGTAKKHHETAKKHHDTAKKHHDTAMRHHDTAISQLETADNQLITAEDQLQQAKDLMTSLNDPTDMGAYKNQLGKEGFQDLLPDDYSKFAGDGNNAEAFKGEYSYYDSPANDFYRQELSRQKKATYQDMVLGQAVYDQASTRMDSLNKLRDQLGKASSLREAVDLQTLIQVESTLVQNEINKMQGLAMVQQARDHVHRQRNMDRKTKLLDEMKKSLDGN